MVKKDKWSMETERWTQGSVRHGNVQLDGVDHGVYGFTGGSVLSSGVRYRSLSFGGVFIK